MTRRLLVIGGDAAGMSAASQARRLCSAAELDIVVFERGRHVSYSACGMPYLVGGDVASVDHLIVRTPATFRDSYAIDAQLGHEVIEIDTGRAAVRVRSLETGSERWESFDELVIATGAIAARSAIPGSEIDGVFGFRTLDDAIGLCRHLEDTTVRRALVIGGGYIGLEVAEALVARGLDVTMATAGEQPMQTLDPEMAVLVADALRAAGVALHLGERVHEIARSSRGTLTAETPTRSLAADVVVMGLGTRPNSALAAASTIPIGPTGGIVTDARMHTPVDGVWAAGDCVESRHRVSGQRVAVALGTHANKQGRVAGTNLGGGNATFPGVIGTAITRFRDLEIARTGLGEAAALAAGFDATSVTSDSTTRAGYFPGAAPIRTKLVVERPTGRLLGAQIVGGEGAAKRIDTLAVAIWNRMTAEELSGVDLAYAPPFAPVWDPVLLAARKAAELTERERAQP